MALHSGSFQHRSWDSGFYFLFQFCVRFSVIVRFLQNASFEIGSSTLPPPPLSEGPLADPPGMSAIGITENDRRSRGAEQSCAVAVHLRRSFRGGSANCSAPGALVRGQPGADLPCGI